MDLTDFCQLQKAFKDAKNTFLEQCQGLKITIYLNNAGITGRPLIGDKHHFWRKTLGVLLTAVIQGTQLALDDMIAAGEKEVAIINVASMAGFLPIAMDPVYTAAKHGVVGFSRSFEDLQRTHKGLRVNCICPSYTLTPMVTDNVAKMASFSKLVNQAALGAKVTPVKYVNAAAQSSASQGTNLIPVSLVVDGIMQLIEDDSLYGQVMRVTLQKGIDMVNYNTIPTSKKIVHKSKL